MPVKSMSCQFRLFLEAESDSATAIHGLRWLLKAALRRYGLRCTSILSDTPDAAEPSAVVNPSGSNSKGET
jgi:hypothetical protein